MARFSSTAVASSAPAPARSRTPLQRLRALLRCYQQLSKARLSLLVTATASAGYVAGSREQIDWVGLGWTTLGTFMAASCANTLNQVYEISNDALMKRTAARPLPSGRLSRPHALAFAAVAGVGGIWILAGKTNALAAELGAANIALYAGVYTPLKVLSVANTWVGAVVGAVPPLMGWAAAAGSLDLGALILALGVYFWQMPHFMALAWLWRADYAAGGYRMLSLVDPAGLRTARVAFRNSCYLFPLGLAAAWLGVTSPYFAYESGIVTGGLMLCAAKFVSSRSTANARLLLYSSLVYLPCFMLAFLAHRKPNDVDDRLELVMGHLRSLGLFRSGVDREDEGEEREEDQGRVAAGTSGSDGAQSIAPTPGASRPLPPLSPPILTGDFWAGPMVGGLPPRGAKS